MEIGIVGGGIGGLTTALLLSRRGCRVTVHERAERLGGRLSAHVGERFRIDRGPTIVLLPDMIKEALSAGGMDPDCVEWLPCDPLYRIHYADGTQLTKWRDPQMMGEELDRVFPGERAGFGRFMRELERRFRLGKTAFLDRPFLRKREFFSRSNVRLLLEMQAYRSVRSLAARYFRDERLQDAYSLQTLYIGGAPDTSPSLYAFVPYAEHAFGIWMVKGGYWRLIEQIEAELRSRGVTIHTNSEVERLQVKDGICNGLRAGGVDYRYDAVVYNGDFPCLPGLLDAGEAQVKPRRFRPSSGCVLLYLRANRRWAEAAAHQFFLPAQFRQGLRQLFREGRLPDDPAFYAFNPVAVDDSAAADGESALYVLIPAPTFHAAVDWEAEAPALARRVLAEAERRGFPGLQEAVLELQVRTPKDDARSGLFGGGSFGLAPTLLQSGAFRPQLAPYPISRLYAVGASIHPGGGIPVVMQGATLLVKHMEKELDPWTDTRFSPNAKG